MLYPEELAICADFERQRALDFRRGRFCARQCLQAFHQQAAILKHPDGSPVWPTGFTGSISHSRHLAGALVTSISNYRSIGLDIEQIGRIGRDLWPVLFTKNEIRLLTQFRDPAFYSTLFFSLKEAFFKLQYPLTGMGMEFDELEIVMSKSLFSVKSLKELPDSLHKMTLPAHYQTIGNQLISYIWLFNKMS